MKFIDNKNFQKIVVIFSFTLAIIFLILSISQTYYFLNSEPEKKATDNNLNISSLPPPPPKDDFFRGMPKESPFMFTVYLLGFLVNVLSGLVIYNNLHKHEKKDIKLKILDEMLMPEEKQIIKILEENNGEITQSELVKKSGLGKLKVSRVIKKLESSKIIKKYPYGLTNNVKLLDRNN